MTFNLTPVQIPVESSSPLLLGPEMELPVYLGKVILPEDIVEVIEGMQEGLQKEEQSLILLSDFLIEYRCFPFTKILSDRAKNAPFAGLLHALTQKEWVQEGTLQLPKEYVDQNTIILEPRGHYFALRYSL